MGYYTEDKATPRKDVADPLETVLHPAQPRQASNQARFTSPDAKDVPTKEVGNQEKSQPNNQGTGKENIPSSIALAPKRRLNIKMPANY